MKPKLFNLALLISTAFISTNAIAQSTPLNSTEINTKVQKAFESVTLEKIAPPKTDITIAFPSQDPSQPARSVILKAGESWSELPIGVITNLPNGKNVSFASIVADIYPNPVDAQKALDGALSNFTFLKDIPIKALVERMPKLANLPLLPTQIGSLSGCDSSPELMKTLGQIAKTNCGSSPIPSDVLKAIPISQTGIQNISYQELASKLDANSIATSAFPLAQKASLKKLIIPDNFSVETNNLFKLDYLDTKLSKQSGNGIKGINPISGSNRVENASCKNDTCDYAVLLNFVGGTIKENPYNHALALQINSSGTTWLDGGIGSIGRTLWNFKEPPGASLPFNTDYMKLVLEKPNPKAGTVQQNFYLAFCMQITFGLYSEWNCSSKFIGPIPVPWEETSEKSKTMLLPIQVKLPAAAITAPVTAAIASAVPKTNMIALYKTPSTNSTTPAYKQLFGANTLTAYSPTANITNVN